MDMLKSLNWIARAYLFLCFLSLLPLYGRDTWIWQFLNANLGYIFLGLPVAAAILIVTTATLNRVIKRWKYVSGITLLVLIVPLIFGYFHDLNRPPVPFDTWGLEFIPIYIIGVPLLFFSFIRIILEERREKKTKR